MPKHGSNAHSPEVFMNPKKSKSYSSVWDALFDDPEEATDLKKRSGYLILIVVRLNGQSGSLEDKAERLGLPVDQVRDLVNGGINKFNLKELTAIARKIGITTRL